jgi:hypothetical protein
MGSVRRNKGQLRKNLVMEEGELVEMGELVNDGGEVIK